MLALAALVVAAYYVRVSPGCVAYYVSCVAYCVSPDCVAALEK